jgi:hypothetical protein
MALARIVWRSAEPGRTGATIFLRKIELPCEFPEASRESRELGLFEENSSRFAAKSLAGGTAPA